MSKLRPWREVAMPHEDVLKGTFQQAEFAADISRVHSGTASAEYQDASLFFQRTFITEGMRLLLLSVLQRLSGKGGDPVIQLQTAFGGGKTHTMLAVYHLASSHSPSELMGIPSLLDEVGLSELPQAKIAVIDGVNHAPNQPKNYTGQKIHTLWGELAFQLAGADGYALVSEADASGTSPSKDVLIQLLNMAAPCVVLMDELVSYMRQFADKSLTGGTLSSNLSFIQALTEALKAVPTAILLASLPASEKEAGDNYGVQALSALSHTFARVQALWKPIATEEAFEIVRRRLFSQNISPGAVEETCKAFADFYIENASLFPQETQVANYLDRLRNAYPIHPEVFDRLYEDWSSLDNFQRTRGVLKFMAKVIHRLWQDGDQDALIMPGNLPLYSSDTINDIIYYLPGNWSPVIDRDIDGNRAETLNIETLYPLFGSMQACRRLARTIFLGSAPSGNQMNATVYRGIDEPHIYLGAAMPGQTCAAYRDALSRLEDKLYFLNRDAEHYWFDTRPNLRREVEERKKRFSNDDINKKLRGYLQASLRGSQMFENKIHVFAPSGDIPDDESLRLVVLKLQSAHSKSIDNHATDIAREYIEKRGEQPRLNRNRLIFLAAEYDNVPRIADQIRSVLAWESIVNDISSEIIMLDQFQIRQAKDSQVSADRVAKKSAEETYRWVLAPNSESNGKPDWDKHSIASSAHAKPVQEIERILKEYELVIDAWAPFHLDAKLKAHYWKQDRKHIEAKHVWQDFCRYLYLPRLLSKNVLLRTLENAIHTRDFFATAQSVENGEYKGLVFGKPTMLIFDDSLLIVSQSTALKHEITPPPPLPIDKDEPDFKGQSDAPVKPNGSEGVNPPLVTQPKPVKKRFFGSIDINPNAPLHKMQEVVNELIMHFSQRADTKVKISIEIEAECQDEKGFDTNVVRTVSENANVLGFKVKEFE